MPTEEQFGEWKREKEGLTEKGKKGKKRKKEIRKNKYIMELCMKICFIVE